MLGYRFQVLSVLSLASAAAAIEHTALNLSSPRRDIGAAAAGDWVVFGGGC